MKKKERDECRVGERMKKEGEEGKGGEGGMKERQRRDGKERTSESPQDPNGNDDHEVLSLEEEGVPYPKLSVEGESRREEGDVPLRCIRRRRDHFLFLRDVTREKGKSQRSSPNEKSSRKRKIRTHQSRMNLRKHAFEDPLLDVEGLEHSRESRREDAVEIVLIV